MPVESAHQWPDLLRVASIRLTEDGVTVVLANTPQVSWTVQCVMHEGRPRVIRCTAQSTSAATPWDLDGYAGRPPLTTLAAIWARTLGKGAGNYATDDHRLTMAMAGEDPKDHPDWDRNEWLDPAPVLDAPTPRFAPLGKKPDARQAKRDPEGYAAAMHQWTRPVADVVRYATAQNRPVVQEVAEHLSPGDTPFSTTYAERLIAWATDPNFGHDLPKRPRKAKPKTPATRRKGPTQSGRSDK